MPAAAVGLALLNPTPTPNANANPNPSPNASPNPNPALTLTLTLALTLAQVGRALLCAPLLRADAPVVQQQAQAARVRLLQPLGRGRARVRRRWTAQQRAGR